MVGRPGHQVFWNFLEPGRPLFFFHNSFFLPMNGRIVHSANLFATPLRVQAAAAAAAGAGAGAGAASATPEAPAAPRRARLSTNANATPTTPVAVLQLEFFQHATPVTPTTPPTPRTRSQATGAANRPGVARPLFLQDPGHDDDEDEDADASSDHAGGRVRVRGPGAIAYIRRRLDYTE